MAVTPLPFVLEAKFKQFGKEGDLYGHFQCVTVAQGICKVLLCVHRQKESALDRFYHVCFTLLCSSTSFGLEKKIKWFLKDENYMFSFYSQNYRVSPSGLWETWPMEG